MRYTAVVDDGPPRRRLRRHLSVRVALPPGRQDQSPLRGRGTVRRAAAPVPPRQPHLELPLAATDRRSDGRGPPLRGLRPHGLRPLREASAPVRLHARAPRRERPGPDRRARPARHHARGPRLGRADRPRRDARAARAPERDRPHEHLGLGAALVAAALHTRVPHRGTRRDPRPGRQPLRRVDPGRHGPPRRRPGDDGRLPRPVPRLLVARGHPRLPARDPAHRARPQRPDDLLDPRAASAARRPRAAPMGNARPGLPARLPRPVARAVPARRGRRPGGRLSLRRRGPPGRRDRRYPAVPALTRRDAASRLSTLRGSTSTLSRLPKTTWTTTPPKRSASSWASRSAVATSASGRPVASR